MSGQTKDVIIKKRNYDVYNMKITITKSIYQGDRIFTKNDSKFFFYKHGIPNVSLTFPEHVNKKFDPLGLPNRLDLYFGFWLPC